MGWAQSITDLTLAADGTTVGSTDGAHATILSASWGSGRPDWFASLSPSSASFSLLGDLTASVTCGDSLALKRGTTALWTGKVDTVTLIQATGQPDTTTVTGADLVAQLGEAKVKGQSIALDEYSDQLGAMLTAAGVTATVTRSPGVGDTGVLAAWSSYTGTVLDWVTTAERYANCITSLDPDGSVLVCARRGFPDYATRCGDPAGGGMDSVPDATSVWPMEETSGTIGDTIGSRDLTAIGTPTYSQTGPWGASGPDAVAFQKADAADTFSGGDVLDLSSTTTWTWAGWAYWAGAAGSDDTLVAKITSTNENGWEVLIDYATAAIRFRVRNAGSTTSDVLATSSTVPTTTWFHWAVVRDGSSLLIYVNGTQVGSGTAATPPNTATSMFVGSRSGTTNWFGGRQCSLAVWGDALTSAQIGDLLLDDIVALPTPRTWSESRSIASVINHWLIGGSAYSDATSISTHGRRTWDVDSSTEISGDAYTSALRTVMKDPRPLVTATLSVTSGSSDLITVAPLDVRTYDGAYWQLLSVQHELTPSTWDVTLTLDRTKNDMTSGGPLLPV